jgi:ornithine--oxo-acid transaminase
MLTSTKIFNSVYSSMERAVVHSSTFSRNQLAMVAGLATLQTMDDEDIVDRARRTGELLMKSLAPLVDKHEFLHEVRGLGLMVGLVFGEPQSRALRMRWRAIEAMRTAMFSQLVVVPLFHRHRILTQVAADNVNIVKLLPPLIAGEEEIEYFVAALDDVLTSAAKGSGLFYEFGKTVAKGSLLRTRS